MISLMHEPMLTSDGSGQRHAFDTNAEAPSRGGGTPGDATEHPKKEDEKQRGDETLAPGQSATPPGEVRPGHNPEKP
jgi:hypothetical protein